MADVTPPSTPPRQTIRTAGTAALLLVLLIVGTALRVYGLAGESAWLDEAFAVGIARLGWSEVLYQTRLDVHPPLYYMLLTGWLALVGDSVWSARLLSVVLSVALLAATALVGARLAGRAAGLTAAALLAVSVFHVEFAQEARMYSMLALLATLSTAGFIALFEDRRRQAMLFYVAVTALMVWTHVYAAFVIGAQGVAILVDLVWRRQAAVDTAARWVWAQVFVVAAVLPWLPVFVWQMALVQSNFWIAEPEPWGFLAVFRTYAGSEPLLWVLAPLALLGAGHLAWRWRSSGLASRSPLFFLIPWLAGPILFPFVVSLISQPIFLPKYTIAASVPFAILVAAGVQALPTTVVRTAVISACLLWSGSLLPDFYARRTKDGWREAVPVVERLAKPSDAVVVYPYFNTIAWDFYQQRDDLQVRAFPLFSAPPPADGWPVTITRATAGRSPVWFVTLQADRSANAVLAALARTHDVTAHHVRQKIAIYRLDRRP